MTTDEELQHLEELIKRLRREYDTFFSGGFKRPPQELEAQVTAIIKKYGDSGRLNYNQRFRFNTISQQFGTYTELWRKKMRIREEGYRRPQDALLSVGGLRTEQEHEAAAALRAKRSEAFVTYYADPTREPEKVKALYDALVEARSRMPDAPPPGSIESFTAFLSLKTEQVRKQQKCKSVEVEVATENGQVRLKVRPKK